MCLIWEVSSGSDCKLSVKENSLSRSCQWSRYLPRCRVSLLSHQAFKGNRFTEILSPPPWWHNGRVLDKQAVVVRLPANSTDKHRHAKSCARANIQENAEDEQWFCADLCRHTNCLEGLVWGKKTLLNVMKYTKYKCMGWSLSTLTLKVHNTVDSNLSEQIQGCPTVQLLSKVWDWPLLESLLLAPLVKFKYYLKSW